MSRDAGKTAPFRVGKWLPSDQATLERWIKDHIAHAATKKAPLHPVVQEFKDVIEADPALIMLFNQMFEQVPHKAPYNKSPAEKRQVRSFGHMIDLINAVMTKAPEFNETGLVGCPINAILDWSMGTSAGFAAFVNPKANAQLKKVLNEWGTFLKSEDSRSRLLWLR